LTYARDQSQAAGALKECFGDGILAGVTVHPPTGESVENHATLIAYH